MTTQEFQYEENQLVQVLHNFEFAQRDLNPKQKKIRSSS